MARIKKACGKRSSGHNARVRARASAWDESACASIEHALQAAPPTTSPATTLRERACGSRLQLGAGAPAKLVMDSLRESPTP
jgi:hypothetical protein